MSTTEILEITNQNNLYNIYDTAGIYAFNENIWWSRSGASGSICNINAISRYNDEIFTFGSGQSISTACHVRPAFQMCF